MSDQPEPPQLEPSTFRFFLNVREAFPYEVATLPTKDWNMSSDTIKALELLPESERSAVLRFFRQCDAALCLGSLLLKHLAIVRGCGVSWSKSHITQERHISNGKPFYAPGGVQFNVSHHGEVVVLVGSTKPGTKVGIDVVKVDVESQRKALDREHGFDGWVRVYEEMFSQQELEDMSRAFSDEPSLDEAGLLRQKLRFFYANWACKEAYIKMTSDALGADYLRELHFDSVVLPEPSTETRPWVWGGTTQTFVRLGDRPVEGVRMEIRALGQDYMVATAISDEAAIPPYEEIRLYRDILPFAEG